MIFLAVEQHVAVAVGDDDDGDVDVRVLKEHRAAHHSFHDHRCSSWRKDRRGKPI